jgi:hypothetical protein
MAEQDSAQPEAGDAPADMLREIFTRQAGLAAFYGEVRPVGFYSLPPLERCTTWTRAIIHECCEVDDELGWKPWKNSQDADARRAARLLETADILHFLVQLALDQGFTAEEMYEAYMRKNAENRARQLDDPQYRPAGESEEARHTP